MRFAPTDTIVASSSAIAASSRTIIRLSGPMTLKIMKKMLDKGGSIFTNRLKYSSFNARLSTDTTIIPCTLFIMRSPHSYTCEDMVEIHMITSMPLISLVIDRIIQGGARLAQPGEFTLRAYLNGRIDLAQAEAVMTLIEARSQEEFQTGFKILTGQFSRELRSLENELLDLYALVEAQIDFIDQDVQIIGCRDIIVRLNGLCRQFSRLYEECITATSIRDKISVLIFGPSNSGKSTLFNRLVDNASAIVSDVAGTTRDIICGDGQLGDLTIRYMDSAGVDESFTGLNLAAARKSFDSLKEADFVLVLIDPITSQAMFTLQQAVLSVPHLIAINKIDLLSPDELQQFIKSLELPNCQAISALKGDGIEGLRKALHEKLLDKGSASTQVRYCVSARQRAVIKNVNYLLNCAKVAAQDMLSVEFIAYDLKEALEELASITGRKVSDNVLDCIFERFCIGK